MFNKMRQLDIIMESDKLKERQIQIGEKNLAVAVKHLLLLDFSEVVRVLRLKHVIEDDIIDTFRVTVASRYTIEKLQSLVTNMAREQWGDEENILINYALDVCSRFLALEIYFEHERNH